MSTDRPSFVFVHGAWHNKSTWDLVTDELVERGYATAVLDLPGAGANAKHPKSFSERPLDPAAFGTEPSPNAGVRQVDRTASVVKAIQKVKGEGNGKVVLVGHSLGGLTISPVAELVPEDLHSLVYLTAFLLPPEMVAGEIIGHQTMANAMVPSLFMADPEVVGAMRMDTASTDPEYVARAKEAFYADVSDEAFKKVMAGLHPDEPAAVAGAGSGVTKQRWGSVDRHYIRCTEDRAISIEGQDHMIAITDGWAGTDTKTHTMNASHSPFLSDVNGLCDILVGIAS